MVADFGIALAVSAAAGGRMTETGMSLGTPHYMSPEQATADKDLTNRSDIYSLGAVLYEMLTGEPPHTGASAQAIVMKIVADDARPVAQLRRSVPPNVAAAVGKSLEKVAADRFDTAKLFMDALEDRAFTHSTIRDVPAVAATSGRAKSVHIWLPWAAAATVTAIALGLSLRPEPPALVQRYEVSGDQILSGSGTAFTLSPDGSTLAYIGDDEQVFWRPVSALEPQLVAGSEQSRSPFFSPDGRSIGFTTGPPADDRVRTVSLDGAPPRTLAGDHFPGAAWGDDGFVYYVDIEGGLYRVSDQGGDPETLVAPGSDSLDLLRRPEPLPGGKAVLVHDIGGNTSPGSQLLAFNLETRQLTPLEDGTHARFANGHLFWVRERTLFAAPFDPDAVAFTGPGVEIADRISPSLGGSFEYAVSETGTLLYMRDLEDVADASATAPVGWFDQAGNREVIEELGAANLLDVDRVSLSRDGRYVALEAVDERSGGIERATQIWIFDFEQSTSFRLTFQGTQNSQPRWMPDGRHVAYLSNQGDGVAIWTQPFDRTGSDELLVQAEWPILAFDVAAVAGRPVILVSNFGPTWDLWLATPGDSAVVPYVATDFNEWSPRISPDGRWVAYTSDESGRDEVYVRAFPEGGRPWPISRRGRALPVWGPSGEDLFYVDPSPGGSLFAAKLSLGEEVRVIELTEIGVVNGLDIGSRLGARYDVSRNGERFIVPFNFGAGPTTGEVETIVVLNLFEELRARRSR